MQDIVPLARLDSGSELYCFRYQGHNRTVYVGVMAQEVQDIEPSAVSHDREVNWVELYDLERVAGADRREIPSGLLTWSANLVADDVDKLIPTTVPDDTFVARSNSKTLRRTTRNVLCAHHPSTKQSNEGANGAIGGDALPYTSRTTRLRR